MLPSMIATPALSPVCLSIAFISPRLRLWRLPLAIRAQRPGSNLSRVRFVIALAWLILHDRGDLRIGLQHKVEVNASQLEQDGRCGGPRGC